MCVRHLCVKIMCKKDVRCNNGITFDRICFQSTHPSHLSPSVGAIGQLLDSLEEIQVLAGASEDDVNFLQNFFEHQTLQALLEVRMQFVKSL